MRNECGTEKVWIRGDCWESPRIILGEEMLWLIWLAGWDENTKYRDGKRYFKYVILY